VELNSRQSLLGFGVGVVLEWGGVPSSALLKSLFGEGLALIYIQTYEMIDYPSEKTIK
jgi:hypothetical protein